MQEAWSLIPHQGTDPVIATKSSHAVQAKDSMCFQIHKEIKTKKRNFKGGWAVFMPHITITLSSTFTQSLRGQSTFMFFAGKFYFCSALAKSYNFWKSYNTITLLIPKFPYRNISHYVITEIIIYLQSFRMLLIYMFSHENELLLPLFGATNMVK